jgi:hypothetical protein
MLRHAAARQRRQMGDAGLGDECERGNGEYQEYREASMHARNYNVSRAITRS